MSEDLVELPPSTRDGGVRGIKVMSQSLSVAEAEYAPILPAKATGSRRESSKTRTTRSRHPEKRLPEPMPVPDLDWPSNLYADDASIGELVAEDFPLPPHIEAMLFGHAARISTRH